MRAVRTPYISGTRTAASVNGNGDRFAALDDLGVWRQESAQDSRLRHVETIAVVNDYKGGVLETISPYRPMPKLVLSPDAQSVILANPAIDIVGSFAPTIDDAGFSMIAAYDHATIYYDGTNGSKRILRRRADSFKETLPPGQLAITGLTPSAVGADVGPTYYLFPYFIAGACNIGWVPGNAGTPRFAHLAPTNDALHQQRYRGREPLTDDALPFTLVPVPAPPDPSPPGPSSGSTGATLSVTVVNPTIAQRLRSPFIVEAFAVDTTYTIRSWEIRFNGATYWALNPGSGGPLTITQPFDLPDGDYLMNVIAINTNGQLVQVNVYFTLYTPAIIPPDPPPDPKPIGCVMLGTDILPIGSGTYSLEQMAQHDWIRLYTAQGRELVGTPDHPVYTSRAGRTELRDCRKDDKIVTVLGEEDVQEVREFTRPGVKVCVRMSQGHLFWANGILSHNKRFYG